MKTKALFRKISSSVLFFGAVLLLPASVNAQSAGPNVGMLAAPNCVEQMSQFSPEQRIEFGVKRLENRSNQINKIRQSVEKRYGKLAESKAKQGSSAEDQKKLLLSEIDATQTMLDQLKAGVAQGDPAAICSITTKAKVYSYLNRKITYQMSIDTLRIANDVNKQMNDKLAKKASYRDQTAALNQAQNLMPQNLDEFNAKSANQQSASKNYFVTAVSPKLKEIRKANAENKKAIAKNKKAEKKEAANTKKTTKKTSSRSSSSSSSGGSNSGSGSGDSSDSSSSSSNSSSSGSGSSGSTPSKKKKKKPSTICKDQNAKEEWQKRACKEGAAKAQSSKDYGGDAAKACNKKKRAQNVYEWCAKGYKAAFKDLTGKDASDTGYKSVDTTTLNTSDIAHTRSFCKAISTGKPIYKGSGVNPLFKNLSKKDSKLAYDACMMGYRKLNKDWRNASRWCETGGGRWDERAHIRRAACVSTHGG